MTEARAAWDEVGERFSDLGKHLKDRYDANVGFAPDQREAVSDAVRRLTDALDAGFTAIGFTLRDPDMREELKHAGASVRDALAATFNEVAEKIKG
ncbi:MAG TPA: hypothetical protein VFR41_02370 [Acidimicrobiia bacterium]|nr:hypothetical protein [Acidimicrobiia bacterium]